MDTRLPRDSFGKFVSFVCPLSPILSRERLLLLLCGLSPLSVSDEFKLAICPFELLFQTTKGSGYDVACAQSNGAILYNRGESGPLWSPVLFDPKFKKNLYFIYLGRKQNTLAEINNYQELLEDIKLGIISDDRLDDRIAKFSKMNEVLSSQYDKSRDRQMPNADPAGCQIYFRGK